MSINDSKTRTWKKKIARLVKSGRLLEAKPMLEKVCKNNKYDIDAWFLLSTVYGKLSLYNDVVVSCRHVLSIDEDHAGAHSNLGNVFASQGLFQQALQHYTKALQLQPNDSAINYNMGNILYLSGNNEAAIEHFQHAIEIEPKYADAYFGLGKALNNQGLLPDSILRYHQALAIDPKLTQAYIALGHALGDYGRHQEAEDCFRQGLQLEPESIELNHGLAILMRYQGKFDDALTSYQKILRFQPNSPIVIAGEADIYERKGEAEEAYKRICMLLETNMINVTVLDVFSRICQQYNRCDEAIELCNRLLDQNTLSVSDQRVLHYAFGKLHDKLGAYDNAYKHYQQANDLARFPFDPDQHADKVDALISAYSEDMLGKLPQAKINTERPVFIIGMPRSGTSLVEQIISSHPLVYGAGELNDINDIVFDLHKIIGTKETHPKCLNSLTQRNIDQLSQNYLNHLEQLSTDALRVTDKMPNNYFNLGLVSLLFPQARVIHCVRNSIDTCLSIYFQSFGSAHPYANNLVHLGKYYLQYQRLMSHWESNLDIPIMTVNYEALVSNHGHISRDIIAFCDLDWDDSCLYFYKSKREVATASYDQVRQPMYTKSISRWMNYEKHIEPLLQILDA